MTISYPLNTPTDIGIAQITLSANNKVAISESPFTAKQQVVKHPAEFWTASVTIPTVRKELAEPWVSFLLSLGGRQGTFLLGDPNRVTPLGTASVGVGTPVVNGNQAAGNSIAIRGLPLNRSNFLFAGDYIQFGSGDTATLHKVLNTVTTSATGTITVDIWPRTRRQLSDGETVVLTNCKGKFRLSSNTTPWSINEASFYQISFDANEAI